MARNPYANSIIVTYEVKVYVKDEAGNEIKKLRVAHRKFGNGTESRVLEKRKFYFRDGNYYVGNAMGFNAEDVKFIGENWQTILKDLDMTADTLRDMTQSERDLPDGKVFFNGKIYDADKFYPRQ